MEEIIIVSIQMIIIVFFMILITCIIIFDNSLKKERRISSYSIDSMKTSYPSIFENIYGIYKRLLKSLRSPFKKIFKRYLKKYDKYISSDKETIDYIINKFMLGISFVILVIVAKIFQRQLPSLLILIICFIIGFCSLDIFYRQKNKYLKKEIENELLRAIIIMNNAFKSGKSTLQAVEIAGKELPRPISDEFKKMYKEMKYGLSVDAVFDRFAKRVDSSEAKYIASSLIILNKTGGNIIRVFDSIEKTLYEKKKLVEEKKNLTSSSNMVIKVLLVVPILFVVIIYLLSPTYFNPLFESIAGYIVLGIIIVLFILYVIVLEKIVKVKV